MFNIEVRNAIRDARLYGYEVAAALNMSETAFSRMISRQELSKEKQEEILDVINRLTRL